jgi:hypothetical protein
MHAVKIDSDEGNDRAPFFTRTLDVGNDNSGSNSSFPFANGSQVITVPSMLSESECKALREEAFESVRVAPYKSGCFGRWRTRREDCVPRGKTRVPVDTLSDASIAIVDSLLSKVTTFLEEQISEEARAIFGQCHELSEMAVTFQLGEPSINVYTHGGEFAPHTDDFHLTILVPLSPPRGAFVGGGTAFWSKQTLLDQVANAMGMEQKSGTRTASNTEDLCKAARQVPPTLLEKPAVGTGILWTGTVMHAGQPVIRGIRQVLVCSFSLCQPVKKTDTTLADGIAASDALSLFFALN